LRVKLIAVTCPLLEGMHEGSQERLIASAARCCWSSKPIEEIYASMGRERVERFLEKLMKLEHLSPFEHVSLTFYIEGISRVTSHQLVRHRIASYSQQSQRHVKVEEGSFITPPSIRENPEALRVFEEAVESCMKAYRKLVELGVHIEDARYIIPQAVKTNIVVTMNVRELLHFFKLRLAPDAQWEIRMMASEMLKQAAEVLPTVFKPLLERRLKGE